MFAGHYSAAFAAKAASPTTPLWVLLLAAQFVDVLWVVAILSGIEQLRLDPSLPSNPLDLYHMPWTHSLVATLLWAGVAFGAAKTLLKLGTQEAGFVAAVVVSHWFLDLVVHRPDLTIAGGEAKLGFALWNVPVAAWLLEMLLVAATVAMARSASPHDDAGRRLLVLGGALLALQTATAFGPLPTAVVPMVLSSLTIYVAVTFAGRWVENRA
jgi:hypothetical protein